MRGPSQILSDCPHCRVESALVELIDPSERVGIAIEGRCRLCGYATELGEVVRLSEPFVDEADVIEALARWAAEDGEPDVAVFVAANFNGRGPDAVARAVLAGERVDTGFDVIAWLFPGQQGGGRRREDDLGGRIAPAPLPTERGTGGPGGPEAPLAGRYGAAPRPPIPNTPPVVTPPRAPDPRDITRALVSVMVADGRILDVERRFLAHALERLGAPPPASEEERVWRPQELGPVADPSAVMRAMHGLAVCDDELDGSELRVLEEFARAWSLPPPRRSKSGPRAELARAFRRMFSG